MAFALHKNNDNNAKRSKRSPLAGWLGRKENDSEENDLPEIDVAAGVNRALTKSKLPTQEKPVDEDDSAVRDALGSIEAALYTIDRIRDTLEQTSEILINAKDVEDIGGRALLAERYDELRLLIDQCVRESDARASRLIGSGARQLDVLLCGRTRYTVAAICMDISDRGLSISPPRGAFSSDDEIDAALEEIDYALNKADRAATGYCRDAQFLIARMKGEFSGK